MENKGSFTWFSFDPLTGVVRPILHQKGLSNLFPILDIQNDPDRPPKFFLTSPLTGIFYPFFYVGVFVCVSELR